MKIVKNIYLLSALVFFVLLESCSGETLVSTQKIDENISFIVTKRYVLHDVEFKLYQKTSHGKKFIDSYSRDGWTKEGYKVMDYYINNDVYIFNFDNIMILVADLQKYEYISYIFDYPMYYYCRSRKHKDGNNLNIGDDFPHSDIVKPLMKTIYNKTEYNYVKEGINKVLNIEKQK